MKLPAMPIMNKAAITAHVIFRELPEVQHIAEKKVCLYMSSFMQGGDRIDFRRLVSFEAMQTAAWSGEMKQLVEDLENFRRRGYKMFLVAGSDKTLSIIKQDIEENGIPLEPTVLL